MNKGFMTLLSFATVIAIFAGLYIHVFGWGFGSNGKETEVEESFSNVKEIVLDANIFNLTIKDSDSDQVEVRYEGIEKLTPVLACTNGKLKITQKEKSFKIKKMSDLRGKSELVIKIPKGAKFEAIDLNLDLGNIDADSITADDFDVQADLGKVEIRELTATDAQIQANLGDVCIKKAIFKDMDIDADLGNIELETVTNVSDYSISIDTDLGDNTVEGTKVSSEYHSEGNAGEIEIECDLGNVNIYTAK